MDSPSLLLLCTHNVRFILLGGGGRGRFGDDLLDRDDLGGDGLHDEAYDDEVVELVADIVDGDNDGGDGDDISPVVLLRRGGVECIILFGIVNALMYIIANYSFFPFI